jgi:ketosteroid isomerase-like protein
MENLESVPTAAVSPVAPSVSPVPPRRSQAVGTSEQIRMVRQVLDAFAKRDVQAALELADPRIELVFPTTADVTRGGKPYRGFEGVFAYFRDIARVWDELEIVPRDFREVVDDVLVFGRLRARRVGGLLLDAPAQWLFQIREGKVVYVHSYPSQEEALEAAGLSE